MPENIDKVVYPSLSADGWVFSSEKQLDWVMADFLAVDRSQSYVHDRDIFSFGWIMAQYSGNIPELTIELKRVLTLLMERYFNTVYIEVYENKEQSTTSKVIISLFVEVQLADGTKKNISQLVQINGSKFELIRSLTTDSNSQ